MTRFPGWTETALNRITQKQKPLISKKQNDYVSAIADELNKQGIEYVREYKFLKDRRFRFDIALPKHKIAVEFEGGIWTQGRHTRGKGYISDVKKYNLATMHGWKLLRYTTNDTKKINWQKIIADEIINFANKETGQVYE